MLSTLSIVTASQARRSERCVVRWTTRRPPEISIVATLSAPERRWSSSMCPTSS